MMFYGNQHGHVSRLNHSNYCPDLETYCQSRRLDPSEQIQFQTSQVNNFVSTDDPADNVIMLL